MKKIFFIIFIFSVLAGLGFVGREVFASVACVGPVIIQGPHGTARGVLDACGAGGDYESTNGSCQYNAPPCDYREPTLTPSYLSDVNFVGWSGGGCSGTGTCATGGGTPIATFTIKDPKILTVEAYPINVPSGETTGSVQPVGNITGGGISCGSDCAEKYTPNGLVSLNTYAVNSKYTFLRWSDQPNLAGANPCDGADTNTYCSFRINSNKSVYALYTTSGLSVKNKGLGKVTSSPSGIDCGFGSAGDCNENYALNTAVTLTAVPDTSRGSSFTGWSGDIGACSSTAATCAVTLDQGRNITATFSKALLTAKLNAIGRGLVTASGINCGTDCDEAYNIGTSVTLSEAPAATMALYGWAGCDNIANFSGDAAIAGGYDAQCVVKMDDNRSVEAFFDLKPVVEQRNLTAQIKTNAGGAGLVKSVVNGQLGWTTTLGISCGATTSNDCSQNYSRNSNVGLAAQASPGSEFAGWLGGDCSGRGSLAFSDIGYVYVCETAMDYDRTVQAWFRPQPTTFPTTLSVSKTGTGGGTVDSIQLSSPDLGGSTLGSLGVAGGGINCGMVCSEGFTLGTVVTLTAESAADSEFIGWTGCDVGAPAPVAPSTVDDGSYWEQATANANWTARSEHTSLVFGNKIWVLGGKSSRPSPDGSISDDKGEAWSSSDGVTWALQNPVLGSEFTSGTLNSWRARVGHASAVFNNKMWVIGGQQLLDGVPTNYKGDAWSSLDGINWTPAGLDPNMDTPSLDKKYHSAVAFNNAILVMGGLKQGAGATNEIASLGESGASSGFVPPAPMWSARYGHASVVFEDKIWVLGGNSTTGFKKDVWYSSNGNNWTQATAVANWPARAFHQAVVFDNKIWVLGGYDGTNYKNDVWYSADGVNWTQATAGAGWVGRYSHSAAVFNGQLWILGGRDSSGNRRDVWHSAPPPAVSEAPTYSAPTALNSCNVTMDTDKNVTAQFNKLPTFFTLTIRKSSAYAGTVTAPAGVGGSGINCGNDCYETYVGGTSVQLNASEITSWSGCTSNQSDPLSCLVTMDSNKAVDAASVTAAACTISKSVTAEFEQPPVPPAPPTPPGKFRFKDLREILPF